MPAAGAGQRKNPGAEKREGQADPIGKAPVRVHARDHGHSRSQSGDLCESQVNENYSALDDVHAEVGVNARQNEAGDKRQNQKRKNFHPGCLQ